MLDFRNIIEELIEQQKEDKRYSLRAFAKDTGINVGDLSKCLTSKRMLLIAEARNILSTFELNENQKSVFVDTFLVQYRETQLERLSVKIEKLRAEFLSLRPTK